MSDNDKNGDHIQTGNVSGTGIAIGRKASATVTTGIPASELESLFKQLGEVTQSARPEDKAKVEKTVQALKDEVAKGSKAEDSTVAKLIDKLVEMVPDAVGSVVSMFATPILGGIVGPVTKFVLDELKKD